MPKRFCQCRGCPVCGVTSGSHGTLYDADSTGTLRCPGCQTHVTARRNARPSSTSRGYGVEHRKVRTQMLEKFRPGDPCAHCGQPMWSKDNLDLAHTADRTGYRGLAHAECNRGNV